MAENKDKNWEKQTIEKIAMESLLQQKSSRRWGILFKVVSLIYLGWVLFFVLSSSNSSTIATGNFTALINLNGEIGTDLEISATNVKSSLKEVYENPGTKALILAINSPGGSPVQSGIINDEISRYKLLHPEIPVYAVVEDICASGGYYIAVAADKIFVDKASIVGSIGVLMNGFGFDKAIKNLGIERRLITSGENKAILDPFLPVNPEQREYMQNLLKEVHNQFITVVKEGRGNKLAPNQDIFSGLFWSGESAIKLGLADGYGDIDLVAREVVGHEKIINFTTQSNFADRFAKKLGASIGSSFRKDILKNIKLN
jgi:protease-4|tara:strand:- start:932 stop:1876 length:945 start_codon:yes stop_codon:yes gene_type:complete